jgi:hypothetical protein
VPRPRTTKGVAKRIELTYYRKPHPFRRWWRILGIAVPAVGAAWLLALAALGDQRVYSGGSVVAAHRMFESDCGRCHAEVPRPAPGAAAAPGVRLTGAVPTARPVAHTGGWFFRPVSDGACLACHDGTIHHDTQTFEPTCGACHIEHRGETSLTRVSDRHCTMCHADLKVKATRGAPKFEPRIPSLAEHPEFAVFRKGLKDEAQIKLSHATHLKADLPAGGGKRVTLACEFCHKEDAAGRYMLPIVYETHCAECHPLEVADGLVVPHERPEIVRGILLARLGARGPAAPAPGAQREAPATAPPAEEPESGGRRRRGGTGASLRELLELVQLRWDRGVQLAQRRRGGATEEAPAETKEAETSPPAAQKAAAPAGPAGLAAVSAAEKELFTGRQGCRYCHTVDEGEQGLPRIVPPKIPNRWLPQSAFDHRAHRALTCVACHDGTPKSLETTDVLMPRIGSCRECHRGRGGARSGCVECHLYHDRAKERPAGGHTVPEFVTGRPRAAAPAVQKPSP